MDAGGLGMGGCGWMWMMDVVGVTLLLRCGGVYTAESDAQHPSIWRLSIYLEYLSPPRVYLSIYLSIYRHLEQALLHATRLVDLRASRQHGERGAPHHLKLG